MAGFESTGQLTTAMRWVHMPSDDELRIEGLTTDYVVATFFLGAMGVTVRWTVHGNDDSGRLQTSSNFPPECIPNDVARMAHAAAAEWLRNCAAAISRAMPPMPDLGTLAPPDVSTARSDVPAPAQNDKGGKVRHTRLSADAVHSLRCVQRGVAYADMTDRERQALSVPLRSGLIERSGKSWVITDRGASWLRTHDSMAAVPAPPRTVVTDGNNGAITAGMIYHALLREAVASTALDRDQTHSIDSNNDKREN